jgi:hypothetical protein
MHFSAPGWPLPPATPRSVLPSPLRTPRIYTRLDEVLGHSCALLQLFSFTTTMQTAAISTPYYITPCMNMHSCGNVANRLALRNNDTKRSWLTIPGMLHADLEYDLRAVVVDQKNRKTIRAPIWVHHAFMSTIWALSPPHTHTHYLPPIGQQLAPGAAP